MRLTSRCSAAALLALLVVACGRSSPTSPSPASNSTPASTPASPGSIATATGRTVDALNGGALPSIIVSTDDGASATSGADGVFRLTTSETGVCRLTASGPGVVPRETSVRMSSGDASLPLIPSQFDLATFDEMIRGDGSLHRWTGAPGLVIVDAVLKFTGVSDAAFTATEERLTADERQAIAADLAWGLPQVTGNAFSAFASVTVESPAPGTSVNFFSREGQVVVARFSGLSAQTGYWGYGRWARGGDAVVAGAVMLDRDFDAAHTCYGRSLRVHELGHALGYAHVTKRQSFMNASAVYEPNDFDRDATKVAFQRLPGNRSPDRDPSSVLPSGRSAGALAWSVLTP